MISERITFMYEPKKDQVLFTLENQPIISIDNISGLTADIGTGKSHVCEIFAAYWINPKIANNHLKCINNDGICLYIDTERSPGDCFNGLLRIEKHCKQSREFIESKFQFERFTKNTPVLNKIEYIHDSVKNNPLIKFVIIDGILDLLRNSNDIGESNDLSDYLANIAEMYNIGILYTLHGNRNDISGKGKGHIGDTLQRKSESYLKILKDPQDRFKRVLTANFDNGKVRNGDSYIHSFFEWNNTENLFQEYSDTYKGKDVINPFVNIFKDTKSFIYSDLVTQYVKLTSYSEASAHKHIKTALNNQILKKDDNKYYLNNT